jgi:nitric oxide reductase large subunit
MILGTEMTTTTTTTTTTTVMAVVVVVVVVMVMMMMMMMMTDSDVSKRMRLSEEIPFLRKSCSHDAVPIIKIIAM